MITSEFLILAAVKAQAAMANRDMTVQELEGTAQSAWQSAIALLNAAPKDVREELEKADQGRDAWRRSLTPSNQWKSTPRSSTHAGDPQDPRNLHPTGPNLIS